MRAFLADTLAPLIFFTITGVLNECFVAGMAWNDILVSRSISAALMVPTARLYGIWRDWFVERFAGNTHSTRAMSDAAALMIFQVPIYAIVIWFSGAEGWQIVRGCLGFAVLMLVLGRPYGLWLDFVRSWFGLSPSKTQPVSLKG